MSDLIFVRPDCKGGEPTLIFTQGKKKLKEIVVSKVKWDAESYPLKDFLKTVPVELLMFASACDFPKESGWDMRKARMYPQEMITKAMPKPTHCPTCGQSLEKKDE